MGVPYSVAKRKMEGYVNAGGNVTDEFEMKKVRLIRQITS